jgi:hypothetical protein
MNTVLIAVTALSLAMAAGMAIVVIKLLRDDRARSEARVLALGALSGDPIDEPLPPSPARAPRAQAIASAPQLPRAARTESVDDFEIRPATAAPGGSNLFAVADRPSPWGGRFAVIGVLATIGVLIVFGAMHGRSNRPEPAAAVASIAKNAPLQTPPLELLSLHHTQEDQRLVIAGVVRNPRDAAALSHIVATAFLFGPDGTILTTGRAPLDLTTLSPGVESPFVVSVPVTGQISRYRIGFRTDDDRVIAHVDKRTPEALAQK